MLLWSAQGRFDFNTSAGSTYTAIFDPATGTATERHAIETTHNMFCPGTTNLPDGRLLVNGGSSSGATSVFDPLTERWTPAAPMTMTRAYQANTLLSDGSVFTLGGSWNGGTGNKNAEVWTEASGWRRLPGVPVEPMLGPDPGGVYRGDNHMWLFAAANGRVLHAGPSANMHWIDTRGSGATLPAGPRGDDPYAMNGSIAMYDIGKLLKTGGAPAYQNVDATASAHVIDLSSGIASVRRVASMGYRRAMHNSVVLPNGQVMLIGGQTVPVPLYDSRSVLVPELWEPRTETFIRLPAHTIPRNYHSTALLLPDARVAAIGGGLCGATCAYNHADLQIYTPHYLLNADGTLAVRPAIRSAPAEAAYGSRFDVETDSSVAQFVLIRLSSVTHGVNNDQRRVPLVAVSVGINRYTLTLPTNPGIALPGHYMLFAIDGQGVPSIAKTFRVAGESTPRLVSLGDQLATAGDALSVNLMASGPGSIVYGASGLPAGLTLNAATGAVEGVPSVPGVSRVSIWASNASGRVSSDLLWTVRPSGTVLTRYVKLEALSSYQYGFSTLAELNLLTTTGTLIPRSAWTVSADSQEVVAENGRAGRVQDGLSTTAWHTQYRPSSTPLPHSLVIDLGTGYNIGGFRLLPRQDTVNGRIKDWRFSVSADGVNWVVAAQGALENSTTEKTIFPIDTGAANRWPTLATPANPTFTNGDPVSIVLQANDSNGDRLGFAVRGLPPGMSVNAATGLISGSPTETGVFEATAEVADGRGGTASAPFVWTVLPRRFTIAPVAAPLLAGGGTASYAPVVDAGVGARYQWDFGDGSPPEDPSSAPSASHSFASPGVYTVTLTVTDNAGAVQSLSFLQAVGGSVADGGRARASSNLVIQPGTDGANARLWVVNQDADSVSLFDAVTLAKLGEVGVGSEPRSAALAPDGRLWVVNKGSSSISIVDARSITVAQTLLLPRASQPFGVAFAPSGASAYVSLEARGELLRLDPASGAVVGTLVVGPGPRHLAVTPASDRVLVSRFVTPPQPGEGTAFVREEAAGVKRGGEVVIVNAAFAVERIVVLQHSQRPDSTLQGRGLPNYLAAAAIAPDGLTAWVPSKQDNIARGSLRDGQNLDFQNTVRAISSRIDLGALAEDHPARIDHDNAGVASAAAFHPSGAYLFVALQTSRQIAVIDPRRGTEVLRVETGRAPDGLALSTDGLRLYVNNFMDRSVHVFDLSRLLGWGEASLPRIATLQSQSGERLAAAVLQGKRLFYDARDPRLARDGYLSCAACHADGSHDGRTWDFTGFGEGLRNTISLRGRAGAQGMRHWSGNFDESQDFEGQIRSLAKGTGLMSDELFNAGTRSLPLGAPKAGVSADLDALAAYLASLDRFAATPRRQPDGALTMQAVAGRTVFAAQCLSCHGGAAFSDSHHATLRSVGTLKTTSGGRLGGTLSGIDTPGLRDSWSTAPYLHDGSALSLADAIGAHTSVVLTAEQLRNVVAYVEQIGSEEPGVRVARFVRLQALSEVYGRPWTTVSEFNLIDASGANISRTGWIVWADSEELVGENGRAVRAIDGRADTIWHTRWKDGAAAMPHSLTVDLGAVSPVIGFRMLPRQDAAYLYNGRIAAWRFFVSHDGLSWHQVANGVFANTSLEKTVVLP